MRVTQIIQKSYTLMACLILALLAGSVLVSYLYQPLDMGLRPQFYYTGIVQWGLFLAFCVGLYFALPKLKTLPSHKLFWGFTAVFGLLGIYFLLSMSEVLKMDSAQLYYEAAAFNDGNIASLTTPGGYFHQFPHQLGILTLFRLYHFITPNPKFGFFINLLYVLGANYFQYKTVDFIWKKSLVTNLTIIFSFLFLPHFFFIIFLYGALPGLFFSSMAIYYLALYQKTNRYPHLTISAIALALATIIRNNYQIIAIALVGITLLQALSSKSRQKWLTPVILIAGMVIGQVSLNTYYQIKAQQPLNEGIPKVSYLVMGMSESPNEDLIFDGWWNGYTIGVWGKANYDTQTAKDISHQDLSDRIKEFVSNPFYAISYFYGKIRSTWSDPLYSSIANGTFEEAPNLSNSIWKSLYSGQTSYLWLYNIAYVIMLFLYGMGFVGSLKAFITPEKNSFLTYPILIFLGVFSFHLFWETRSYYGHYGPYFLVPVAVIGFLSLSDKLRHYQDSKIPKAKSLSLEELLAQDETA